MRIATGVPILAALLTPALLPGTPPVDPGFPSYRAETAAAGVITCTRAESMESLVRAWARGFQHRQPLGRVELRADTRFAAEAFPLLLDGTVEIVACPREMFPAEIAAHREKFGDDPLLVAVATGSRATVGGTHAIAIHVNAANPLAGLTLGQLREILAADGRITTWGQLGLTGEWASQPIRVHGMVDRRETGNPPGIVNYLATRLQLAGRLRPTITAQADAPGLPALAGIVRAVAADRHALGYSGFSQAIPGTRTLPLAETAAGPFYPGTAREIADRTYPLCRTIYLCVRRTAGRPLPPAVREFLLFVLSREGQQAVADDPAQFLPLPAELAARERAKLE